MIKRLRIQFICVTMVLVAIVLSVIFAIVCQSTWNNLDSESDKALQSATFEPLSPGGMPDNCSNPNYPCFILCLDPMGELYSTGHANYDLSDTEMLMQILQETQATEEDSGMLEERNLKFMKIELWKMKAYIFTDITLQIQTMRTLIISCTVVFCLAMVLFFVLCWLLSRWLVRPIEQAWQQQRQFVADASHELKTPLTIIITNGELLQSGEYAPEDNARFIDSIAVTSKQMRGLVNNLLELARVDNSQSASQEHTTVNFSDLTEGCVMNFEPVYFEAGRTLESDIAPGLFVKGRPQHLQQVVDILLDNGQKYSTPGTVVQLYLERQRNHCHLRVISQGEALTVQQCEDIFKRFYRVDEARSRTGSYGLGLSIAESIVQEHRGKIWAQSKDGVNTFYVTLPIAETKE